MSARAEAKRKKKAEANRKELRVLSSHERNKQCMDCVSKNPPHACIMQHDGVVYGIFLREHSAYPPRPPRAGPRAAALPFAQAPAGGATPVRR
eukprot:gene2872-4469_t